MAGMQIGVDLAKSVFKVQVLLEACGSAHHWGRELQRLGHTVRLLPAGAVARYRDGNKTDVARAPRWARSIGRRYDCGRPYAIGEPLRFAREESRYACYAAPQNPNTAQRNPTAGARNR
jgi:transposase